MSLSRFVGKVAALLHCSFTEVLLLDVDNLPLINPEALFEDPMFAAAGNLFWPDYWDDWIKPGVWNLLGLNATTVKVGWLQLRVKLDSSSCMRRSSTACPGSPLFVMGPLS